MSKLMRVHVDIRIEGIASHGWSRETDEDILGLSCLIESLAPKTANRKDLSLFKTNAWCVDPKVVLLDKLLWVLEPREDEGNPAASRAMFRQLLQYSTVMHGRLSDFLPWTTGVGLLALMEVAE